MRLLRLNEKCPNRKKILDIEICKKCGWFAGRTPIKDKIYVKCGLPKELLEE